MTPTEKFNLELKERLEQKLSESALVKLMSDFNKEVSHYPASLFDNLKDKRQRAVEAMSSQLYPFHTVFSLPMNNYSSSVVLISNEVPVFLMAKEAAHFVFELENFYLETKKANSVQELQQYYKRFTLKPKQVVDALLEDLKMYAKKYEFETKHNFVLDIKEVLAVFNEEKLRLKEISKVK